jgi:hypothetical protein
MLLLVCVIEVDSETAIFVVPAPRLPSQNDHDSAKIIQSVCTASFMLQVGRVGKKGAGIMGVAKNLYERLFLVFMINE